MAYTVKLIILFAFITQCLTFYNNRNYNWRYLDPERKKYDAIRRQNIAPATKKPKPPVLQPNIKEGPNFELSFFQTLGSYHVNATPVSEKKYPWIAKVVHSRISEYPYMCTAVCVEELIFITAGRCISNLKTTLTTVIYQNTRFNTKVFVIPSKPSQQMYEDVGIILVERGEYKGKWETIEVYNTPRPDNHYEWFANLKLADLGLQHKTIGYVADKFFHRIKTPDLEFSLMELDVIVDIFMCSNILGKKGQFKNAYLVPCYMSCPEKDFNKNKANCKNFLGTEGAAVLNTKTNKLLGLATWGIFSQDKDLPVGIAVPNSQNYFKDLACARKIKNNKSPDDYKGYYQNLCILM